MSQTSWKDVGRMGKRIPLNPSDALKPEVARFLERYEPRKHPDIWARHSEFILAAVRDARPRGKANAEALLVSITKLVGYTERRGYPLTRKVVFHPEHITSFLQGLQEQNDGTIRPDSLKRTVGDCERVGRALVPENPWSKQRPFVGRSDTRPPYTREQEALYVRVARTRENIHLLAVLVLGFGAGLDGRWQRYITPESVTDLGDRILTRVPKPDRTIVLLRRYHDDMRAVLARSEPGVPLIGGRTSDNHPTSYLTGRLSETGLPPLERARIRSTWIVRHLQNRTDFAHLHEMAGTKRPTSLWDLLVWVERKPADVEWTIAEEA